MHAVGKRNHVRALVRRQWPFILREHIGSQIRATGRQVTRTRQE